MANETNNPNSDAQYNADMAELAESQLGGAATAPAEGGSFFDKSYNALRLKKRNLKKPIVKRQIIRTLHDAWEAAETIKDECKSQLFDIKNNLENGLNVNAVINVSRDMRDAQEAQDYIANFYQELFDKPISKISIEDEE